MGIFRGGGAVCFMFRDFKHFVTLGKIFTSIVFSLIELHIEPGYHRERYLGRTDFN